MTAATPILLAQGEDAVRAAAEKWLALIDQGKYKDAYRQSSQHVRARATAEEWEPQLRAMREPAGALKSRTFSSAKAAKGMAGAPDGEYVVIQFAAAFEKKATATETVMMSREGAWKAAGYFIG